MKTATSFLLVFFSIASFQFLYSQAPSQDLQVTATLDILDGQMDNFKQLAKQCIATVKEKDTGTLQYDWFLDEANKQCIVREKYVSSEAVLEHMANLGDILGQLLATCELKVEVFGTPSEELLQATAEMDIKVYPFFGGLD